MNVERMNELATMFEQQRLPEKIDHFDIGTWGIRRPCGTAACVAGCAVAHWQPKDFGRLMDHQEMAVVAAELLDLDYGQRSHLFLPSRYETYKVTPAMAAERIRKMVEDHLRKKEEAPISSALAELFHSEALSWEDDDGEIAAELFKALLSTDHDLSLATIKQHVAALRKKFA